MFNIEKYELNILLTTSEFVFLTRTHPDIVTTFPGGSLARAISQVMFVLVNRLAPGDEPDDDPDTVAASRYAPGFNVDGGGIPDAPPDQQPIQE